MQAKLSNIRIKSLRNFLTVSFALTVVVSFINVNSTNGIGHVLNILFGYSSDASVIARLFTIQNIMWWIFSVALAELYWRHQYNQINYKALGSHYLSEVEQELYTSKELIACRRKIVDADNLLASLIKTLILRYQASQKSVEETHQMLNSQLELLHLRLEVDYNITRYLIWLIPTLGFIGTVWGIALALNYAGSADPTSDDFLAQLTVRLAVAFYTTLVALVMSAVLVLAMHIIQGREEHILQRSGEYCLNNLINKLSSSI